MWSYRNAALWSLLGMRARLAQVPVEAEVFAGQQLGGEDDLSGVPREMLHHAVDGLEHRDVVALDADALGQPDVGKRANQRDGRVHGRVQASLQLGRFCAAPCGKFAVAIARERLA